MGGWHIAHRATDRSGYIGVVSTIKLPKRCGSQNDDPGKYNGVFPEFIHGFYAGGYGIDIGIVYRNGNFEIFYHALNGTCKYTDPTPSNPPVRLNVSKGDTIQLKTYINNNGRSIVAEVWKGSNRLGFYETEFTSSAARKYVHGARLNREIVMAANRKNYIPCSAYFSDITMSDTMLTDKDYSHEKLTKHNSELKIFSDEGRMDGYKYGERTSESNGFIVDMGSCDFR